MLVVSRAAVQATDASRAASPPPQVPNAVVLDTACAWFGATVVWAGFVRWTVWNTLFLLFIIQAHSANPARCKYWRESAGRLCSIHFLTRT